MKIKCPKSGLTYYTSVGYGKAVQDHPIFSLPISKLLSILDTYSQNINNREVFKDEDIYLLALAFLNHGPIEWRTHVEYENAYPILRANIEQIVIIILKLHTLPKDTPIPHLVISSKTASLYTLRNWLDVLKDAIEAQAKSVALARKLKRIDKTEEIIKKLMMRGLNRKTDSISNSIAEWASEVAEFPTFNISIPTDTAILLQLKKENKENKENSKYTQIQCNEYWKEIIKLAWKEQHIDTIKNKIRAADIEELIYHCEDNIPHGSTYAYVLMKKLRDTLDINKEFTTSKSPNSDIPITIYKGQNSKDEIKNAIESITLNEPKRKNYANGLAYIQARIRWQQQKQALATRIQSIKNNTD